MCKRYKNIKFTEWQTARLDIEGTKNKNHVDVKTSFLTKSVKIIFFFKNKLFLTGNYLDLFQLFQKCLRFKILWNVIIQTCDNFVDLFFPGWIHILSCLDCFKEFLQCLFNNPSEPMRNLKTNNGISVLIKWFSLIGHVLSDRVREVKCIDVVEIRMFRNICWLFTSMWLFLL